MLSEPSSFLVKNFCQFRRFRKIVISKNKSWIWTAAASSNSFRQRRQFYLYPIRCCYPFKCFFRKYFLPDNYIFRNDITCIPFLRKELEHSSCFKIFFAEPIFFLFLIRFLKFHFLISSIYFLTTV